MKLLKFDYCNWGQLDKVNQSVYRKITIHSKKVGYGPISSSINSSYSKRKIEILIANKTRKQNISRDNVFLFENLQHPGDIFVGHKLLFCNIPAISLLPLQCFAITSQPQVKNLTNVYLVCLQHSL